MTPEPRIEQRTAQRRHTLKGGRIVFNSGRSTFDCTVRNLSRQGAKLQVGSSIGIPERFELMLENAHPQPCRVVWRKAKEVGIVFIEAH